MEEYRNWEEKYLIIIVDLCAFPQYRLILISILIYALSFSKNLKLMND